MKDNRFDNMSDEQLVSMVSDPFVSSSSDKEVRAELYRREKKERMENNEKQDIIVKKTKGMHTMTIFILILTGLGVIIGLVALFK